MSAFTKDCRKISAIFPVRPQRLRHMPAPGLREVLLEVTDLYLDR